MASPQFDARNLSDVARYEPYVSGVVARFRADARVAWFEIFNEPEDLAFSMALRAEGYAWALAQLPTLVRGLGFYPTAWEEALLVDEAAAAGAARRAAAGGDDAGGAAPGADADAAAAARAAVGLADALRLYVNHRPVRAPGAGDVAAALDAIAPGGGGVAWGALAARLCSRGEPLSAADLATCAATLVGDDAEAAGGALLARALARGVDAYAPADAPLPGALRAPAAPAHARGARATHAAARAPLPAARDCPVHDDDVLGAADLAQILAL